MDGTINETGVIEGAPPIAVEETESRSYANRSLLHAGGVTGSDLRRLDGGLYRDVVRRPPLTNGAAQREGENPETGFSHVTGRGTRALLII